MTAAAKELKLFEPIYRNTTQAQSRVKVRMSKAED